MLEAIFRNGISVCLGNKRFICPSAFAKGSSYTDLSLQIEAGPWKQRYRDFFHRNGLRLHGPMFPDGNSALETKILWPSLTPLPSIAMGSGYTDLCHQTEAVPWKQRYYDSLSPPLSIAMGSGYTDHPRVGRSDGRLLLPDVFNFLSSK